MSMKAIAALYQEATSLAPAARTASANGTGVDLANCTENMVIVQAGTITDGTHTPKLQDSPDNSTWSDVPASNMVGSLANLTSGTTAGALQDVSYIGAQRYLRVVMTVAGATTGGIYGAIVVTKHRKQP